MSVVSKILYKAGLLAALVGLWACEDHLPQPAAPVQPVIISGDSITVTGSLNIPGMNEIRSRALDRDPDPSLKLTLFEFDYVRDKSSESFLTNVYKAEVTETDGDVVTFKVTLKSASTAKVLHLAIGEEYFSADNAGSEAGILPILSVGDDTEAYWGKVVFEDGYNSIDQNGNPIANTDLVTKLTKVPVIRNFARISVEVDLIETSDPFELIGFEVINVPTSGTVVPWTRSTLSTPELLDGSSMKRYADITYPGVLPNDVDFTDTEAQALRWDWDEPILQSGTRAIDNDIRFHDPGPRYMYEHPYESTRRTYLLVYGRYGDTSGDAGEMGSGPVMQSGEFFYKLDIGKLREDGSFNHYNIIRNIEYKIVIRSVNAAGAENPEAAINGVPFNNISASTETASMLSMSDGMNLMIVNQISHVVVDNSEPIEFKYRYLTGVDDGTADEDNEITKERVKVIGLEKGAVIDHYEGPVYTDGSGEQWVSYLIYPNTPTPDVKTQDFTVVDADGLGRTIHLILRTPWDYTTIYRGENGQPYKATVARGDENLYDTDNPQPQTVSDKSGEPLTVYFNLPNGLPEAMFPLKFTIESKNQWIENNKIGNLVVAAGKSLFNSDAIAISYVKTVTYEEYMHLYVNDGSNTIDVSKINTNHTVRCRFLTIVEAEGEDEIRIHNDYFNPDPTVTYTRGPDI